MDSLGDLPTTFTHGQRVRACQDTPTRKEGDRGVSKGPIMLAGNLFLLVQFDGKDHPEICDVSWIELVDLTLEPPETLKTVVKWLNQMLEDDRGHMFVLEMMQPTFQTYDNELAEESPFQFAASKTDIGYTLSMLGFVNGCFGKGFAICVRADLEAQRIASIEISRVHEDGRIEIYG